MKNKYLQQRDKIVEKYAKKELATDIIFGVCSGAGVLYSFAETMFDMPSIIYEKSDGPEILLGMTVFALSYLGGRLINNKRKEKKEQRISNLEASVQ